MTHSTKEKKGLIFRTQAQRGFLHGRKNPVIRKPAPPLGFSTKTKKTAPNYPGGYIRTRFFACFFLFTYPPPPIKNNGFLYLRGIIHAQQGLQDYTFFFFMEKPAPRLRHEKTPLFCFVE